MFHFPLIDPVKFWDLDHYIEKVKEEISEFETEKDLEKKAKECVDILHAAETLVRKFFEREHLNFEEVRSAIEHKNRVRGYYG